MWFPSVPLPEWNGSLQPKDLVQYLRVYRGAAGADLGMIKAVLAIG